jgi:hypothetical protein
MIGRFLPPDLTRMTISSTRAHKHTLGQLGIIRICDQKFAVLKAYHDAEWPAACLFLLLSLSCTAVGIFVQTISVSTSSPSKMVADVPNYIVSALSFIGFILVMIPFPWHWKSAYGQCLSVCIVANQMTASNRGTCFYMVWTALGCLNQFINSVVWNKSTVNKAPVWCDICEVFYCTPPNDQRL